MHTTQKEGVHLEKVRYQKTGDATQQMVKAFPRDVSEGELRVTALPQMQRATCLDGTTWHDKSAVTVMMLAATVLP